MQVMEKYGIGLPSQPLKYFIIRRNYLLILLPFSIAIENMLHILIDYTLAHSLKVILSFNLIKLR